ncbi:MAG TPA: hypothetical protein VJS43_11345 [Candidatus Acidoferrales bacterium]|nr:hypothetical protein [Candidatus Acidoferrales bacterium]
MTTLLRCTVLMASAIALSASASHVSKNTAARQKFASSSDVPHVSALGGRKQSSQQSAPPELAASTNDAASNDSGDDSAKNLGPASIQGNPSQPITPDMKVQIIRYIDGEFGKAAKALPGKNDGFTIVVGKPIDDQTYRDALRLQGTAINEGEPIQVTRVTFEAKKIVLQLNGGAKKKFHLLDHLQIGLGGDPNPNDVGVHQDSSARRGEGLGAVVVLDYGKPLPDVSPNDIKEALSPLIDFSKSKSAAVNWVETLPPAYQDAIRDHKALPGMDQQTVIAAIGRPDQKIRETNVDGIETESWIYGNPPAKTTFVVFIGSRVAKVEVCGGPGSMGASAADCSLEAPANTAVKAVPVSATPNQ